MKVIILLIVLSSNILAQVEEADIMPGKRGNKFRVWIYFHDKPGSVNAFISERAIERRKKNKAYATSGWYDKEVFSEYVNTIKNLGLEIKNSSRWLNAISVETDINNLKNILEYDFVKKIKPVYRYRKKKKTIFKDKGNAINNSLINRDLDYGYSQAQIEQINAHIGHQRGYFGQGIRILLLDTGYLLDHSAFDSLNVIDQYDFINNDSITHNELDQDNSQQINHGTAMLSIIGSYLPGSLIGPAYKSEFLLAKTEDVSNESQVEEDNYIAALEWGEALGADISSSSLGYLDWYSYCDMDGNTAVTTIGVDIASSLGMLCVTSAGNWGGTPPNQDPCQIPLEHYISAPADADSVISVGAVSGTGEIAYFSSKGPSYDGRIKPEVCAMGVGVVGVQVGSQNDITTVYSGTSASCPLVSGAVAIIMSAKPDWTAMQVRHAILSTASNYSSPDTNKGYGIVNIADALDFEFSTNSVSSSNTVNNFHVSNAYPNPFNPIVYFDLEVGSRMFIKVEILNLNGKTISDLFNETIGISQTSLEWDGSSYASGIYFVRVIIKNRRYLQKITLLK